MNSSSSGNSYKNNDGSPDVGGVLSAPIHVSVQMFQNRQDFCYFYYVYKCYYFPGFDVYYNISLIM